MLTGEFFNDLKLSPISSLLAIIVTAIGLISSFLVLLLYLTDYRIETQHENHQDIYRIETLFNLPNGDQVKSAQVPLPLISVLENDENIKRVDSIFRIVTRLQSNDKTYSNVDIFAVSADFLNSLNLFQQKVTHLAQNEIIITPEFNRQYLQLDTPQGKIITLGDKGQFIIKEVVDFNKSSRFKTNAIIALAPEVIAGYHDKRHDWYDTHAYVFITMEPGITLSSEQLNSHISQYAPQLPGAPFSPEEFIKLSTRNITDIHYDNALPDEMSTVISSAYLNILYAAGLFVFLTTTMNFFNINNVINSNKKNSFYIKKAVGASYYQLVVESFFIATLQTIFMLLFVLFILISLIQFSEDVRELILIQGDDNFLTAFSITLTATYVAILLAHLLFLLTLSPSNSTSYNSLYAQQSHTQKIHGTLFCLQIIVAGIIIYLWAGVMTQMRFMQNYDFGYEKENLVTFVLNDELKSQTSINALQDKLKGIVGAGNIAMSSWQPFDMSRSNMSVFHHNQQEKDKLVTVNTLNVNKHFFKVWGITTIAGSENLVLPSDNTNIHHAIATKSFATLMGLYSNDQVLNNLFYINNNGSQQAVRVLQIVDDFYLADRETTPSPLLIFIQDDSQRFAAVKLNDIRDLEDVEKTLKYYNINSETIKLVDNLHKEHFNNNNLMEKTINLVTLISIILIMISTIIVGSSETKRLDKTLKIMESIGGSIYTNTIFFIQQNLTLIFIAAIISLTISFWLLHHWLDQFSLVSGTSYLYATCALLSFILSIVFIMSTTLILNSNMFNARKNK
ncbi:Membrane protein [Yersinia rohdei]|uniref:darobactin export ABC transporter permease subunit n=1 Tax=Yersinia rohdei TaxID=29485 RepID=UPI0005E76AEA|nr:darobactin export ABC transporter permease subunit [Yersinia rohdei]CNI91370.1 Membrane protein [Yersinia rohdei]